MLQMIHPLAEVLTARYANQLLRYLYGLRLNRYGKITPHNTRTLLTRWYLSQIELDDLSEEDTPIHPFFPYGSLETDADLKAHLTMRGVPADLIDEIHRELIEASRMFIADLQRLSPYVEQYRYRIINTTEGDMTTLTLQVVPPYPDNVPRLLRMEIDEAIDDLDTMRVSLLTEYYDRLKDSIIPGSGVSDDALIFSLVRRYMTLGSLNYQSAIPPAVFELLNETFNITHEAFASPINRYHGTLQNMSYGSLYPDIDQWFGAVGSYRDSDIEAGDDRYVGIEANPPFTVQIINNLAEYIRMVFRETDRGVTFAVIIPTWTDVQGYKDLLNSRYLTYHLDLAKEDHQYLVGTHFVDPDRGEYESVCNSTIFILQNSRSRRRYSIPDDFTDRLQDAFICN